MTEYKPTEYVVDFGDYRSNQFVCLSMALIEQNGAKLHERIVRCRDCEYYEMMDEGYLKTRTFQPIRPHCYKHMITVKPDGFCAWSKRKEGSE